MRDSLSQDPASQASVSVVVRVRPLNPNELKFVAADSQTIHPQSDLFLSGSNNQSVQRKESSSRIRRIVKVVDDQFLVFDPQDINLGPKHQRTVGRPKKKKDLKYVFDKIFDEAASQEEVFRGTAKKVLDRVLEGYNATVFAYGATGCGKTHTITGNMDDPGIIYRTAQYLFQKMKWLEDTHNFEISLSYLELYNETIFDLLDDNKGEKPLNLREDADQRTTIPGLTTLNISNIDEVMDAVKRGNKNRAWSPTEANPNSSRSHAILQISVSQTRRNSDLTQNHLMATLSIIDLAGSERAAKTTNKGDTMIEGGCINKSLLALGNCINALCDPNRRRFIPYRNSKLTRLLRSSLGGNCTTIMIVCISPSSKHYEETLNSLLYANRAKEITNTVLKNTVAVKLRVEDYQAKIEDLQEQSNLWKRKYDAIRNSLKSNELKEKLSDYRQNFDLIVKGQKSNHQTRITLLKQIKKKDLMLSAYNVWLDILEHTSSDINVTVCAELRKTIQKVKESSQNLHEDLKALENTSRLLEKMIEEFQAKMKPEDDIVLNILQEKLTSYKKEETAEDEKAAHSAISEALSVTTRHLWSLGIDIITGLNNLKNVDYKNDTKLQLASLFQDKLQAIIFGDSPSTKQISCLDELSVSSSAKKTIDAHFQLNTKIRLTSPRKRKANVVISPVKHRLNAKSLSPRKSSFQAKSLRRSPAKKKVRWGDQSLKEDSLDQITNFSNISTDFVGDSNSISMAESPTRNHKEHSPLTRIILAKSNAPHESSEFKKGVKALSGKENFKDVERSSFTLPALPFLDADPLGFELKLSNPSAIKKEMHEPNKNGQMGELQQKR